MAGTHLTDAEIAAYHENGYVIPPGLKLAYAELAQLRGAYDRLLERNADTEGFDPDFIIGPHWSVPGSMGIKGDPEWLEFARHPGIVERLTQVAGPDLILWGLTIFGKPAGTGKATPMHQDGDYYPIEPLETVSMWIALDDATPENGRMRYVPGSHKARRIFPHHWDESPDLTLTQVIDDDYAPEAAAVDVILEAGQVAIHDVYMVHGSRANTSDKRRAGLVLRVMPASSHYNHAKGAASDNPTHDYSKRPLYLLAGRDRVRRRARSRRTCRPRSA